MTENKETASKVDKRKFNGGNSTKSLKPIDRRKNNFRGVIEDSISREELSGVFRVIYDKAIAGDLAAAKMLLEYSTVKPTTTVEVKGDTIIGIDFKNLVGFGMTEDYIEAEIVTDKLEENGQA
tara:strand:- start:727 stop:1095 length:369 start_codon:yes stop_codon:yes gene_type:complete